LELPFHTNCRFKGAWGRYNQFIKRVENEDILEGSRDFWVLADSVLPPTSAEHRVLGVSYETRGFLFDLEGYHKSLDGVTQFFTRSRRGPGQALDELFFAGTGVAKGLELLVQKKVGPLTGWVSYSLSRVEYDLDDFNGGEAFPASHDQTHEFKTVGIYQVGPWTFSGTWVYGSGRPFTGPESEYVVELLDGTSFSYIHVGGKNAERLPAYHRMDLGATRRFESDRFFYELNVSAFNAYGRNNVWYRKFDLIATTGTPGAYHYPGSDLVIGEGEVFELGIFRGSESLSATTVVPSPPEGLTVSSDLLEVVDLTAGRGGRGGGGGGGLGLAFGGLVVRWTNPERDLYFVAVDNLETDPEQIPAPEFIGQARRFVSAPTPADSTTISQLSLTHLGEHRIRLYHVNQEYADLYEGRVQDSRDLNEPPSNILGGLGVFSAFSSSEGTFAASLTSG